MATACGYTPDQIDQMTLPRFAGLTRYWNRHPPTHVLVAAYLGIGRQHDQSGSGMAELLALFPTGILQ
ncbi:MAG TPA: hypothetical protein VNT30_10430 [Stellaceae bacterium]|nr:hypothetical protein [Stellaceae bacterium]